MPRSKPVRREPGRIILLSSPKGGTGKSSLARNLLVSGCIGEGCAAEFCAFVRTYRSVPDIDALLANPAAAPVPAQPDVLYAVVQAAAEKCRNDRSKIPGALKYAGRLQKEFAAARVPA